MMRTIVTALASAMLAMLIVGGTGCTEKASKDDCQSACDNVAKVAMGEVNKQVEKDQELAEAGEASKEMLDKYVEAMMETVKTECMRECNEKGTVQQTNCLAGATSIDGLNSCQ